MDPRRLLILAGATATVAGCWVDAKPVNQRKVAKIETVAVAAADTAPSFQIDSTPPDKYADFVGAGAYIDSVFKRQLGEAPRMGWFRANTFLTGEKHPKVYVLTSQATVIEGTLRRIASQTEHRKMTDSAKVACDGDGGLAVFDVNGASREGEIRSLWLSAPLPAPFQVGVRARGPSQEELDAGHARLKATKPDALYLDSVFTVAGSDARFVVSAAYDPASLEILSSALVLMTAGGRLAGADQNLANDYEHCANCTLPTVNDGVRRLYNVMNGYTINGFSYPLLLLNTSTNEGQARSLVTFSRNGRYAEYRVYEYMVECGRG